VTIIVKQQSHMSRDLAIFAIVILIHVTVTLLQAFFRAKRRGFSFLLPDLHHVPNFRGCHFPNTLTSSHILFRDIIFWSFRFHPPTVHFTSVLIFQMLLRHIPNFFLSHIFTHVTLCSRKTFTDVSEECTTSIFRINKQEKADLWLGASSSYFSTLKTASVV
jgi:hypothetical protein